MKFPTLQLALFALIALTFANEECGKANPFASRRFRQPDDFSPVNYIIGGRRALPGEFPWQVGLKNFASPYTYNFCGGVIWNERYILTAAHCIVSCRNDQMKTPTRIQICIGDYNKNSADGERCFNAIHWWIHDGYNPCSRKIVRDIGILKMKNPLHFPSLEDNGYGSFNTACHPGYEPLQGTATISGWGRDDPFTRNTPDILKALNVPIWSTKQCRRYWDVDESQICVGGQPGQSACQGDSGGPLVQYNNSVATVVGLTSFGPINCNARGVPSVFTRISYYLPWIEKITRTY